MNIDPILFYPRVSGNRGLSRHPPSPFPPSPSYHGTCNLSPTPYFSVPRFAVSFFSVPRPSWSYLLIRLQVNPWTYTNNVNCYRLLNHAVWSLHLWFAYTTIVPFTDFIAKSRIISVSFLYFVPFYLIIVAISHFIITRRRILIRSLYFYA